MCDRRPTDRFTWKNADILWLKMFHVCALNFISRKEKLPQKFGSECLRFSQIAWANAISSRFKVILIARLRHCTMLVRCSWFYLFICWLIVHIGRVKSLFNCSFLHRRKINIFRTLRIVSIRWFSSSKSNSFGQVEWNIRAKTTRKTLTISMTG